MPEQVQDTFLNSITDDVANSFFEGGASSKNVVTPGEEPIKEVEEGKDKDKVEDKINDLNQFLGSTKFSAKDLLGDRLVTEDKVVDKVKSEPIEEKVEDKNDLDFNFLLDDKVLAPFEDDTQIKSKDDVKNLIKANIAHSVETAKQESLKELVDSLPEEMKFLLEYTRNGGGDLKSVFKLLSQAQEFREYDIAKPTDQKDLIRAYYETQGWNAEEIEDEIINLVEDKRLEAQAQKIKPKLDRITQDQIEDKKEQQKYIDEQQKKARQVYSESVVNTLKTGKIGDLKLNKEEQNDLYNALIREQYQSYSGVTNRLGAILDKIQYSNKPDYEHLMEITMLATDRDAFKRKIREQINTEVAADTIKKIKTEQQKSAIGSTHQTPKETKRLPKLGTSFINNPF